MNQHSVQIRPHPTPVLLSWATAFHLSVPSACVDIGWPSSVLHESFFHEAWDLDKMTSQLVGGGETSTHINYFAYFQPCKALLFQYSQNTMRVSTAWIHLNFGLWDLLSKLKERVPFHYPFMHKPVSGSAIWINYSQFFLVFLSNGEEKILFTVQVKFF